MVSKYVGETGKNLVRVFDGVDGAENVLSCEERDGVFNGRVEVEDGRGLLG